MYGRKALILFFLLFIKNDDSLITRFVESGHLGGIRREEHLIVTVEAMVAKGAACLSLQKQGS